MKVAHWALKNGSGLNRVANDLSEYERSLGINSVVLASDLQSEWEGGMDADIHVAHSHVPDPARGKGKIVWIGHGTPEHCFHTSVEEGLHVAHNPNNVMMLIQYWLQNADALVTFWPRHKAIWETMCHKKQSVHYVPLGINKDFWHPVETRGRWAGHPSLYTAENCHYIKWPLDLVLMWPWVSGQIPDARLHLGYIPIDQHRWWYPLINSNGTAFKSCMLTGALDHEGLRNAFNSIDYYIGLVRYGDYNRISLEAKAAGCKVISFAGNPYADFWLPEGDQRTQAQQLTQILKREVEPLTPLEVPTIGEMGDAMVKIYESIL